MTDDDRTPDAPFLKLWSQRKLAASRESTKPAGTTPPTAAASQPAAPPVTATPAAVADPAVPQPLPPVDTLSFDSDFTAFLKPDVDEALKRQALRKLFSDPRFNVMDGLDVYIDDYGKTVPIPPELVAQLNHAKFLFDPPKTRVNEHGHVEDVPAEAATDAAEAVQDAPATEAEAEAPAQIVDNATNVPPAATPAPAVTLPPVQDETR